MTCSVTKKVVIGFRLVAKKLPNFAFSPFADFSANLEIVLSTVFFLAVTATSGLRIFGAIITLA